MICFILGGIMIAASPNIHSIMEKDFTRRVDYNAKIAGLQFGNVLVRSGTLTPIPLNPKPTPTPHYQEDKDLGWLMTKNNITEVNITCNITAYLHEATSEPFLNVTVIQK